MFYYSFCMVYEKFETDVECIFGAIEVAPPVVA